MAKKKLTNSDEIATLLEQKTLGHIVITGQLPNDLTDIITTKWFEMAREATQGKIAQNEPGGRLDYDLAGTPSTLPTRLTKAIEAGENAARFATPKTKTIRRIA